MSGENSINSSVNATAIRVLIISRDAPNGVTTSRILPSDVEIAVPEDQVTEYDRNLMNPLITVPSEIKGSGETKNWLLDTCGEETLVFCRDDITKFMCVSGDKPMTISDRDEVLDIILNTAVMAKGARAHVFGFNENSAHDFNPTEPFVFNKIASSIIGVVGRKRYFMDDPYTDCAEYSLQSLRHERIVWIDNRYLVADSNKNPWCEITDENRESCEELIETWGKKNLVKKVNNKTGREVIQCKVSRRQKIEYGIWG